MLFVAVACGFLGITLAALLEEELVYPELLQERSESGELVLRIKHTTLHLKKSSVLADDLFVGTIVDGDTEYTLWNGTSLEENLYHDSAQQSSIMLYQDDQALKVEGIINPSWRIAPLLSIERSEDAPIPHTVYRVEETDHRNDWRNPRKKLPEEYVAEIYLISGSHHQKHFKEDKNLIAYMAVLMNAVNVWYEGMTKPKIKTKIVGISRNKDIRNEVRAGRYLNGRLTLGKFIEHVNKSLPGNSDAVYVFTEQDLATIPLIGIPEGNLLGLAAMATLCTPLKVGIGEDMAGTFKGVYTAAHEIIHILGSSHDGGPGAPWIPNNKGGRPCSWKQGYLMSYVDGGVKKYKLSPCTKAQIRGLLRIVPGKCLAETASLSMRTRGKILPGQIMTAEDYCAGLLSDEGLGLAIQPPDQLKQCRMMCCLKTSYGAGKCRKEFVPDGMSCVHGKTCRKGICGYHALDS
ncbi:venom metalloproteinase antarease-like TtrivMP_A isoform X2 [Dermacentor variabilis]|uniref:venom metalloproteinase antarease-like TtrivMP_A isoform X2 n=1 Tax=Dermacentor variabilis TaxID=34621 RepID=UPI003F5AE8BB